MPLGQPKQCYDIGCPLAGKGTGFVLGSGDPKTAKLALFLEAPGRDELTYTVDDAELARRRKAFPYLSDEFLRRGQPVVGKAGGILWNWGLGAVQISRESVFVDNGLRCLPPKLGESQYPTGDVKKKAEACCRQYDRWNEYGATVNLVNIHPAAIARDVTPLPLMIRVFEKAKDYAASAERPLVLCGGKVVQLWMGYAGNVTRWCGHYQMETSLTGTLRSNRMKEGMKVAIKAKAVKAKKIKVKDVIVKLLASATPFEHGMSINCELSGAEYMALTDSVQKKEKKNV